MQALGLNCCAMSIKTANPVPDALVGAFGFEPDESAAHFLVHIPAGSTLPVEISDHLSWDVERVQYSVHYGAQREDGQVRCRLARSKWNDIAEVVRAEFNSRLKKSGKRPGRWKTGYNPVARILGKELTLLAWAIEDADPALTNTAVANWQGLSPDFLKRHVFDDFIILLSHLRLKFKETAGK